MNRRSFITLNSFLIFGFSGCIQPSTEGVNKTLKIINRSAERAELQIVIKRMNSLNTEDDDEVTFEKDVTVAAQTEQSVEVFDRGQFIIEVEFDGNYSEFGTRPICNSAKTDLIITEDRELEPDILNCE